MLENISNLLNSYEDGRMSRRSLVAALAAMAAPTAAPAAESTFHGAAINHLAIRVTDLERSREFYRKHFGAPVEQESATECFLSLDSGFLSLFKAETAAFDHYCISVRDYDPGKSVEKLKAAGLEPKRRPGSQRVYFKDPDGYTVQLSAVDHTSLVP